MPLINCKVYFELNWNEDCIFSSGGNTAKFAITDTKLHVPMVNLFTKDSANLAKQLNKEFEKSVYWNSYETKPAKVISAGYGDDYTNGCLLDYAYFKDNYRLIVVNLSKQKALDADPREIQQIVFRWIVGGANGTRMRLYTIFEKSKETILEFAKGTTKVR